MTVPGRRPERLGEQLRHEIGSLLVGGLRDPRIGFATITEVRVTPDLRQAWVSVSVLGNAEEQQQALEGFRAAAGYIRRELAHRVKLRRMPELEFRLDRTAERAARIDELLRQAGEAESEPEDGE
jgi:ribosome-binding factor A